MSDLHNLPSSLKMIREVLCVAEGFRGPWPHRDFQKRYMRVLNEMIEEIDRQRPLGTGGKHGDLHTPTCGCEDKMMPRCTTVKPGWYCLRPDGHMSPHAACPRWWVKAIHRITGKWI